MCPTLRDPMDYSSQGSSVHGIFQARVLEWVAILGRIKNSTYEAKSILPLNSTTVFDEKFITIQLNFV